MSDDLFGPFDIDAMNETDVREILVRPLLHELGYRQGTPNNILTEKSLHYSKFFLGHKRETDPALRVIDTGNGIPTDRQAELFQPFNRLGAEASGVDGPVLL